MMLMITLESIFQKYSFKKCPYTRDFVVFPDTFELLRPGVFDNKLLEPGVGRQKEDRRKWEKVGEGGKGCGHPIAPNKSGPSLPS